MPINKNITYNALLLDPEKPYLSPRKVVDATASGTVSKGTGSVSGGTVLLIDDDPSFRQLVAAALNAQGHEVWHARSADEASAFLQNGEPSLAIVDYRLPGMDGITWIKRIRERGKKFPVVLCTGAWIDASTFGFLRNMLQVSLVVQKPIVPDLFLHSLEAILPGTPRRIEASRAPGTLYPTLAPGLHEGAGADEILAAVDKAIESETDPEKLEHLQDLRVRTATQQALAEARNDYLKVLPAMWQQFADSIHSARKSEIVDDWKDVKGAAHRLKGSTGSYGLTQLSHICAKLEELIVSLDPRSLVLYDLLLSEIERCLSEAQKLVERAAQEITEVAPAEETGFALLVVSPEYSGLTTKAIELGTNDSSLEIEYAHTAVGAITKCKAYIYDAVVVDLSLDSPETPFELAKELRSLPGYLRKPFGFVTSGDAADAAMMYGGCSMVLDENRTNADLSTMIARLHAACESQRPRILCIDDDESVTRFIEATLIDSGFAVRSLNEPIHAIEAAKEFGPDLILVDVMMPGISGFDVCRALKTHEATAAVPVLFLTASCDGASRSCAFQAGAEDFVAKPIVRDELIARMKPYLPSTVDRLGPGGCALIEKSLFMDSVNQFVATQSGYGAVFLLAIDNMADLQARHGALAADQVSSMMARLVSLRFRPEDLRTQLERDRLAVFVPGITPTQVEQIKAAVRQDIEAMHFASGSGGRFQAQVSIHAAPIGTN